MGVVASAEHAADDVVEGGFDRCTGLGVEPAVDEDRACAVLPDDQGAGVAQLALLPLHPVRVEGRFRPDRQDPQLVRGQPGCRAHEALLHRRHRGRVHAGRDTVQHPG